MHAMLPAWPLPSSLSMVHHHHAPLACGIGMAPGVGSMRCRSHSPYGQVHTHSLLVQQSRGPFVVHKNALAPAFNNKTRIAHTRSLCHTRSHGVIARRIHSGWPAPRLVVVVVAGQRAYHQALAAHQHMPQAMEGMAPPPPSRRGASSSNSSLPLAACVCTRSPSAACLAQASGWDPG